MIHDATIEVTCDGENCREFIYIEPEYVYTDLSGNNGHYDTSDNAINKNIEMEDWQVDGDQHYCEDCKAKGE